MFPFYNNYPGTDLHEIDLAYILKTVAEMLARVNIQDNKIEAVEELAQDLKDFVNNYFDNLDVQEEINNKIDQMVRDGTFYDTFDDLISTVIDAWLQENITPTSPPLDASFTLENAAAQAKAVGDKCYVNRGYAAENADLNDLTDSGGYRFSNAAAASATNCPSTFSGNLLIFNTNSIITQIYHVYNNVIFYRYRTSSAWTAWKTIEPINQVISEGVDFDDYKTTAYYRITGSAAPNCQNIPSVEGGALIVFSVGQATVQYYMNTSAQLYWRYASTSGSWTAWRYSEQFRADSQLSNTLPAGLYAKNRTIIQAHQGYKRIAPANSWIAYDLACRNGFDAVQIAVVRQSADGTWYVMHDADVSTTTNGTGLIQNLSDTYINSLYVNVGNNVDQYSTNERRVPTLEEVLDICKQYGVIASIRLGSLPNSDASAADLAVINSFIDCVNKYNPQTMIFSGNDRQIFQIKKRIRNAAVQVYYPNGTDQNIDDFIALCLQYVYNNASFLSDVNVMTIAKIKKLHAAGIAVCSYFSEDPSTSGAIAGYLTSGADIIQESAYAYDDII